MLERVGAIVRAELAPLVLKIDQEQHYPARILRALGAAGAYRTHMPNAVTGAVDLRTAIRAMSIASEHCVSTSFCMWCQNALVWSVAASENRALKERLLVDVANGTQLGGTGLSNALKAFTGIERFRLRGQRVKGGYTVKGVLPWVSNLGTDHVFATVFEVDGAPHHQVMAVMPCNAPGLRLAETAAFVGLGAARTFAVQLRDVFVPEANIIADPAVDYMQRIRGGFVLLQTGIGLGLIRGCIEAMRQERSSLAHINTYISRQPEDIEMALAELEAETQRLALNPFAAGEDHFRRVLEVRLRVGELSVEAAHFALLHQGARGYTRTGTAQRRLREAYFLAILTPGTKHVRKLLAEGDTSAGKR